MHERRTVRLQSTVTPTEAKFIRQTAKDNGLTVSDLIRMMLTDMADLTEG